MRISYCHPSHTTCSRHWGLKVSDDQHKKDLETMPPAMAEIKKQDRQISELKLLLENKISDLSRRLELNQTKCKCTMSQSVVGDGCRYCQPQEHIDRLEEWLDEERQQLEQSEHKREFAENERDGFIEQLSQNQTRLAELEDVCINIHRDLSIRAEPHDWDNPNSAKVVNLSSGYWDQLNNVLDKQSKLSGLSADAWLLRKQADAIKAIAKRLQRNKMEWSWQAQQELRHESQRLLTQADELDLKEGGERDE